jgi:hypothetical protein
MNFECTIPLISQKTVNMTLPADASGWNFFGAVDPL